MRKKPKSLVLFGNGINCEKETAFAQKRAGFDVDIVHINEFSDKPYMLHRYSLLTLPGGFLDGDDLGAARAQAARWKYRKVSEKGQRVIDVLMDFASDGGLILGICNGFQLLVKTGLLPGLEGQENKQIVSLTFNDSGKFEDRWVYLKINQKSPCLFTRGLDLLYLPCRHGEGKFVGEKNVIRELKERNQIVMQYADDEGKVTEKYPWNPNGSCLSIAGICDETGRIFGLMPHPEAFFDFTHHPQWTRGIEITFSGLSIFENAYQYIRTNL